MSLLEIIRAGINKAISGDDTEKKSASWKLIIIIKLQFYYTFFYND